MLFGKREERLFAPVTGECVPLSSVPDEAFSSGMLGKGFGVTPTLGEIYAPIDGKVESIAVGKHAYTILSDSGLDVLIHIGVDTVTLGGEGFSPQVMEGQRVRAGDLLARVALDVIRQKELSDAVTVIVTNSERIQSVEYTYGACVAGKDIAMKLRLERKG